MTAEPQLNVLGRYRSGSDGLYRVPLDCGHVVAFPDCAPAIHDVVWCQRCQDYKVVTAAGVEPAPRLAGDEISTEEAATLTGRSPNYWRNQAITGKVEARRVGTRWKLSRDAVLAHKPYRRPNGTSRQYARRNGIADRPVDS
jgi:hypothetical protein